MTTWTHDELTRIGEAEELELASARPDGTLRRYVTMWAVRVGDELYVRSAYGPDNPWYRRAKASGVGRVRAGGAERDVTFAEAIQTRTPASTPPTTHSTTATAHRSWAASSVHRPRR